MCAEIQFHNFPHTFANNNVIVHLIYIAHFIQKAINRIQCTDARNGNTENNTGFKINSKQNDYCK